MSMLYTRLASLKPQSISTSHIRFAQTERRCTWSCGCCHTRDTSSAWFAFIIVPKIGIGNTVAATTNSESGGRRPGLGGGRGGFSASLALVMPAMKSQFLRDPESHGDDSHSPLRVGESEGIGLASEPAIQWLVFSPQNLHNWFPSCYHLSPERLQRATQLPPDRRSDAGGVSKLSNGWLSRQIIFTTDHHLADIITSTTSPRVVGGWWSPVVSVIASGGCQSKCGGAYRLLQANSP